MAFVFINCHFYAKCCVGAYVNKCTQVDGSGRLLRDDACEMLIIVLVFSVV